jgi:hypothetical protein
MEIHSDEIPPFYRGYFQQVGSRNPLDLLRENASELGKLLKNLPEEKWDFAYAPGKWTVKELLGHIIDSERVFQYRLLRFSRGDSTELPGFDQDIFVASGNALRRSPESLLNEYQAVRQAGLLLLGSLSPEELKKRGKANGYEIAAGWIPYFMAGHEMHHVHILKERYFPPKN